MSSNLKNEKAAAEAKDIEVNVDAVGVENPLSTGKFVDRAFQLNYWDPEDDIFYAKEGEAIANRNLICSIPNLFLGFAIWLMWSATVVVIQEAYDATKAACVAAGDAAVDCPTYHFSGWIKPGDNYKAILYTIPAIAGLAGGVMRCVNTFMIPISGGRVTVACTTVALLIPCDWAAKRSALHRLLGAPYLDERRHWLPESSVMIRRMSCILVLTEAHFFTSATLSNVIMVTPRHTASMMCDLALVGLANMISGDDGALGRECCLAKSWTNRISFLDAQSKLQPRVSRVCTITLSGLHFTA